MKRVVVESPFRGDYALNRAYLLMCLRDCLNRGEAPFASHLFYTEVLDDREPRDRKLGIDAGLEWASQADVIAVYSDLGISMGMKYAIENHVANNRVIEHRSLGPAWKLKE
jgi:hypothetical protein